MVTQERKLEKSNGDAPAAIAPPNRNGDTADAGQNDRTWTPQFTEAALAVLAIGAWVAVFTAGVAISSQPFRDTLENGRTAREIGMALLATLLTFTPPNVAILCCMSGVIGAQTRQLSRRSIENVRDDNSAARGSIASALLRGFC